MSNNSPDERSRDSFMAMREIVRAEDLKVVFQPIVLLETGDLFAYEALVRCNLPGCETPPKLFAKAVAAGCVGRLGRMIRELTVRQCPGIPLFVNIHPNELSDRWLVRPDDPIFAHDHDLYLEITEAVPLSHPELCRSVVTEVCSRPGFFLVIDDLGAGYSNFKYIADLAPRIVKLDRSLVVDLDKRPRQQQLVSSVVRLCADLGASVVVEGIETGGEFSALRDTGAHYGQGYLFARPSFPLPQVTWPPPGPSSP